MIENPKSGMHVRVLKAECCSNPQPALSEGTIVTVEERPYPHVNVLFIRDDHNATIYAHRAECLELIDAEDVAVSPVLTMGDKLQAAPDCKCGLNPPLGSILTLVSAPNDEWLEVTIDGELNSNQFHRPGCLTPYIESEPSSTPGDITAAWIDPDTMSKLTCSISDLMHHGVITRKEVRKILSRLEPFKSAIQGENDDQENR